LAAKFIKYLLDCPHPHRFHPLDQLPALDSEHPRRFVLVQAARIDQRKDRPLPPRAAKASSGKPASKTSAGRSNSTFIFSVLQNFTVSFRGRP
jgi:hypothetical protein